MRSCTALFPDSISWTNVLAELEAHAIWTLPDPSMLPPRRQLVLDAQVVSVELRRGACYRVYSYYAPALEESREYREAKALMEVHQRLQQRWMEAVNAGIPRDAI